MWDRLLKNAHVVDPVNHIDGPMDIAIEDGKIAAVGKDLSDEAKSVEDLSGLHIMPGLIDSHLHLGPYFGSPYGTRMAALAGVTTCLDMAGSIDEIIDNAPKYGAGINVAMLEGFSPDKLFGTLEPTEKQIDGFIDTVLGKGALGAKLMGGHWPLPLITNERVIRLCNEKSAYIAWHAGSYNAGSNIEGVREVIKTVGGMRLHLAHINAYCRGRILSVREEAEEAIEHLKAHPNIWSESYVSPNNGTLLECDNEGNVIDHVTQTCLKTFGLPTTAEGMKEAFLTYKCFAVKDTGVVSQLIEGEEALQYWMEHETNCAGSFPVNPALSRFMVATAKRDDGSFVVDAISTDGGCIPRNVTLNVGLSLVHFGALTLPEFVVKTSVNPARHLHLPTRGHLSVGATADVTVFDFARQEAKETIVDGKSVMKNSELLGQGMQVICTEHGKAYIESLGMKAIVVNPGEAEPERFVI